MKYDLSKVTVIAALVPMKGGWAEGDDVLSWEQLEPDVVAKIGAGGDVQFSVAPKSLTRVKLRYLHASLNNAVFSALHQAQKKGLAGGFVFGIQGGGYFLASDEAFIEGPPAKGVGAQAGDSEWSILCANCERFDGGIP